MSISSRFHRASPQSIGRAALGAFTANAGSMPHMAAMAAREALFSISGVT
ncbi:hypothetical protein [Desulfovibrio sp. 1214_IL3152]